MANLNTVDAPRVTQTPVESLGVSPYQQKWNDELIGGMVEVARRKEQMLPQLGHYAVFETDWSASPHHVGRNVYHQPSRRRNSRNKYGGSVWNQEKYPHYKSTRKDVGFDEGYGGTKKSTAKHTKPIGGNIWHKIARPLTSSGLITGGLGALTTAALGTGMIVAPEITVPLTAAATASGTAGLGLIGMGQISSGIGNMVDIGKGQ
tara:strand:+ start:132 stop:746 length:615 start_codon:yes stop_codon:yes gene_type:complete